MIFTARQLQELQKLAEAQDQIVLPYGARLTPLAVDWVRSKRVRVGYGPQELAQSSHPAPVAAGPVPAAPGVKTLLWWCDGPCGAAKAALAAQSRESSIAPVELPGDAGHLVPAIKQMAIEIKAGRSGGGVLLVKSAAEPIVYCNRCPSLRAVVGTCLETVDQGLLAVGANVLIVEYPYKTLSQVRNLLSRFARGPRDLSDETQRRLQELAACA